MATLKHLFDTAFHQSLELICKQLDIDLLSLSLMIQFVGDKIRLTALKNDAPIKIIPMSAMVTHRMIGVRMDTEDLEHFFKCLQYAFYTNREKSADQISLLLYSSTVAQKPCVGIFLDSQPIQVLPVSDVLDLMKTGSEQLN